jgi:uncharacterized membrane protein HdeD (DUF308 family)
MRLFFLGAIALASFTATLFFLRFWRDTRDRFFLYFAAAFAAEGVNRMALGLTQVSEEAEPFIYLLRLFSFLLILAGIVDKNRRKSLPAKKPWKPGANARP